MRHDGPNSGSAALHATQRTCGSRMDAYVSGNLHLVLEIDRARPQEVYNYRIDVAVANLHHHQLGVQPVGVCEHVAEERLVGGCSRLGTCDDHPGDAGGGGVDLAAGRFGRSHLSHRRRTGRDIYLRVHGRPSARLSTIDAEASNDVPLQHGFQRRRGKSLIPQLISLILDQRLPNRDLGNAHHPSHLRHRLVSNIQAVYGSLTFGHERRPARLRGCRAVGGHASQRSFFNDWVPRRSATIEWMRRRL